MEAAAKRADLGMIPKSEHRFSEKVMPPKENRATNMSPRSGFMLARMTRSRL